LYKRLYFVLLLGVQGELL